MKTKKNFLPINKVSYTAAYKKYLTDTGAYNICVKTEEYDYFNNSRSLKIYAVPISKYGNSTSYLLEHGYVMLPSINELFYVSKDLSEPTSDMPQLIEQDITAIINKHCTVSIPLGWLLSMNRKNIFEDRRIIDNTMRIITVDIKNNYLTGKLYISIYDKTDNNLPLVITQHETSNYSLTDKSAYIHFGAAVGYPAININYGYVYIDTTKPVSEHNQCMVLNSAVNTSNRDDVDVEEEITKLLLQNVRSADNLIELLRYTTLGIKQAIVDRGM